MTKSIFLVPNSKGEFDLEIKESVIEKFKSKFNEIKFIAPIADCKKSCSVVSVSEANELLSKGHKKELMMRVLNEFKSQNADLVVFLGCPQVGIFSPVRLSLEFAALLNSAVVFTDKDELNNLNSVQICDELGIKPLGFANLNNADEILSKFENFNQNIITPYSFENHLYELAKKDVKNVVLPESFDERILKAADIVLKSNAVNITLLGKKDKILSDANKLGLDLSKATILDHETDERLGEFAKTLFELRKNKGMTEEKAAQIVKDKTYFGTMLVYSGLADAMVSGASTTTAETIRPALQIIKMKPGVATVSGSFIMCMKDRLWLFADCAITPNPTSEQLAGIALSSAKTAEAFGISPKIAMLSYSTGESGSGPDVDFVNETLALAKDICKDYEIDGPMQFDASVSEKVAKKKMPNSKVAGNANVFIFPNLNCGNICYKAVQRSSGAVAIGPILQGLKKPINDLSRGALVEDIVNTILISAIQAKGN